MDADEPSYAPSPPHTRSFNSFGFEVSFEQQQKSVQNTWLDAGLQRTAQVINRFLMLMFLVGQVYIKAPGDGARPGFCWSQKEYVMPFAKAELKLAFHGTAGHAGPKELHQLGAGTNYLMLNNDAECKFWAWPRIWRDKRVFHSNGKHILCLDWIFCTLTEYFLPWPNILCFDRICCALGDPPWNISSPSHPT